MKDFLRPYVTHLNRMERNLNKIAKDIVRENADDIVQILRDEQLGKGIGSDGVIVGHYARVTQQYADNDKKWNRNQMKTYGEPYNFEWSGEAYKNLKIKFQGDESFTIFTKKAKQELMEHLFGELFDLTDEFNDWVNEAIIIPGLQQHIINNLFPVI